MAKTAAGSAAEVLVEEKAILGCWRVMVTEAATGASAVGMVEPMAQVEKAAVGTAAAALMGLAVPMERVAAEVMAMVAVAEVVVVATALGMSAVEVMAMVAVAVAVVGPAAAMARETLVVEAAMADARAMVRRTPKVQS